MSPTAATENSKPANLEALLRRPPGELLGDRLVEAPAVDLEIEPHGGCGDDLDVEIGEAKAGGDADAVEAPAHDMERVLQAEKQLTDSERGYASDPSRDHRRA
jgi:hypothetical protein